MNNPLLLVFILIFITIYYAYIPVYVMMPLSTVSNEGYLNNPEKLKYQLTQLKEKNVDGIMVDVWWGIVERKGPKNYDFNAYKQLVDMCRVLNLKVQVVMSFHRCGGNVNDDCNIPLPQWVLNIGNQNGHIYYTDRSGQHDSEYLSLGVDHERLFHGRTAIEIYADCMAAFRDHFKNYLGSTITTIEVGLGPAGELRYPSYQLDKWDFPGQGEFQCYDKYMLEKLKKAAIAFGKPEWGGGGPSNAGSYRDHPTHPNSFFTDGHENWSSPYGNFFLSWYSKILIKHGEDILIEAKRVFKNYIESNAITLAAKIAGIHWWYQTSSHAAELTAGYYNTANYNGYKDIAEMFQRHNIEFQFTCMEMKDEHQHGCGCSPESLVHQTRSTAWQYNLKYSGENALHVESEDQFNQIVKQSYWNGKAIHSFTFLRLSDKLMEPTILQRFANFVQKMHNFGFNSTK
jgi:beta-amylase